jgi:hypothetical protein
LRQVELVEGALEPESPGVELGAHGAVAQERAPPKALQERVGVLSGAASGFSHEAQ